MEVYGSNPTLLILESIALWNGLICFSFALIFNLFLVLSIVRYSPRHMGVYYKIVQGILSISNISLSGLVVVSRPTMHVHSGIFFFSAQSPFPISRPFLIFLLAVFIFFFVQNKGILATLMVYRIMLMRHGLHHIHPLFVLSLPIISLLITLPITSLLYVILSPTEEKLQRCMDSSIPCSTVDSSISLHLSPYSSFIVSTIKIEDNTNWWFIIAMILLVLVLLSASIVINVGARKITRQATKARDSLQRQLARALYAQSLVPSILVQIPIGIGVGGALFNQDMDFFFHLLPIVSAWYTVVDPLIVFHNVRSYRHAIFRILRLPFWKDSLSPSATEPKEGRSKGTKTIATGNVRVIPIRRSSSLDHQLTSPYIEGQRKITEPPMRIV